ncbi:MAG: 16S rRNA (guanine(527)-N(7))-methyltransferase RsmG [Alphaproteobacteria bacterium]
MPVILPEMSKMKSTSNNMRASHILGPKEFSTEFGVSCEVVEKLELYASLLKTWQKAVKLVAPSTLDDIWHRHFADSAQLLARSVTVNSWVDLGSGGGFPGLVIAIMLPNQENHTVRLIESNGRKCAFLHEVARQTSTAVAIHEGRIEEFAQGGQIGTVDAVTSRALAPLSRLLEFSRGFFAEDTVGLFLKGRDAEREIVVARQKWRFEYTNIGSRTSSEGRIIEVKHLTS